MHPGENSTRVPCCKQRDIIENSRVRPEAGIFVVIDAFDFIKGSMGFDRDSFNDVSVVFFGGYVCRNLYHGSHIRLWSSLSHADWDSADAILIHQGCPGITITCLIDLYQKFRYADAGQPARNALLWSSAVLAHSISVYTVF